MMAVSQFQFQYGTIEVSKVLHPILTIGKFQFQYGTIEVIGPIVKSKGGD